MVEEAFAGVRKAGRSGAQGTVEPLLYKPDWPEARERFLAFWEHEIIDRACIAVTTGNDRRVPLPQAADPESKFADIDYWIAYLNAVYQNTHYGGEAIPSMGSSLGFAVFGGEPEFREDTIWIDPIIDDWDSFSYSFNPHNKWCQHFLKLKRREYEDSRGKYIPALEGTLWPTEMINLFRGAGNLCLDLFDNPEEVRRLQRELLRAWKWINAERFEIVHSCEEGNGSLGMWAPGRYFHLGCDFSCLISPQMYREFVLPEIRDLAEWLDYSFYHLDGPDACQHVPALLELEALDGIQFTIGAGNMDAPVTRWIPLYKQIQAGGKLVRIDARYDEVEVLLEELDPRGIFVCTSAPSIAAAEELLAKAKRWACRGVFPVP